MVNKIEFSVYTEVTTNLGEIMDSVAILRMLTGCKMPMRLAYKFTKILNKLSPETEAFEELRMKLIDQYANRDESGEMVKGHNEQGMETVEINNLQDFNNEFEALKQTEVKINLPLLTYNELEQVKVSEEGRFVPWMPTVIELSQIAYLVEEPSE